MMAQARPGSCTRPPAYALASAEDLKLGNVRHADPARRREARSIFLARCGANPRQHASPWPRLRMRPDEAPADPPMDPRSRRIPHRLSVRSKVGRAQPLQRWTIASLPNLHAVHRGGVRRTVPQSICSCCRSPDRGRCRLGLGARNYRKRHGTPHPHTRSSCCQECAGHRRLSVLCRQAYLAFFPRVPYPIHGVTVSRRAKCASQCYSPQHGGRSALGASHLLKLLYGPSRAGGLRKHSSRRPFGYP